MRTPRSSTSTSFARNISLVRHHRPQQPLLRNPATNNRFTTFTRPRPMPLFSFFGSSSSSSPAQKMTYPDQRSEDEWRMVLNKEQFRILREKGTEPAGSGEYDKHYPEQGTYACAGCSAPLYRATHKFKSGCGWPAYFDSLPGAVERHEDRAFGIVRTEIVCSNCGGHLGHVFKGEGFPTPTDERHCVNSVSIKFSPEDPVVSKDSADKKA